MKTKNIISVLLVVALILTSFAACAGSSGSPSHNVTQAMEAPAAAMPSDSSPLGFGSSKAAAAGENGVDNQYLLERETTEYDAATDMAEPPPADSGNIAGPAQPKITDSRKIIKNVEMYLQTLTFDTSVDNITKITENFGGYVQDSYVQGRDMYNERGTRTANFTIRIPSERLDAFVGSIGSEFHVISKSQNSQDITETYFDSRARLDALKVQEQRLLSMLEGAAELEYMLQIEKELMNVRYEIESLTSSLNRFDNYVSLSTVTIFLTEVIKYEPVENVPVTFGERITRAFADSTEAFSDFLQDLIVGLISVLPFLLLLAAIIIIIVLIARRSSKKSAAKRAELGKNMPAYTPMQYNYTPYTPPVPPVPPVPPSAPVPTDENNDKQP